MLFSIILFTVALQSSAVFLITWHCWPNIIMALTVLLIGILSMPAIVCLLRSKGHKFFLKKWQRRFFYVLFLAGLFACLIYDFYAAGYEIFDPQTFVPVSFIAACLGFDSCYLDYLYRKSRRGQIAS